MRIVIITGQSGSGKSTAIRALEDVGYYCVDNLPTTMVEELVAVIHAQGGQRHLVLGIDVREGEFLNQAPEVIARLRKTSDRVHVVYLAAHDDVLIRRYSETRRAHPMEEHGDLREAIARERALLAGLRDIADDVLETSLMTPHALRSAMMAWHSDVGAATNTRIGIMSFGFKHGVPLEADMVFDVRFLPNPFFDPVMRDKTGEDEGVRNFVMSNALTGEFINKVAGLLTYVIPQFQQEGKRRLTIAVGCTGGRHRSVVVAQTLTDRIREAGYDVNIRHRDVKIAPA